MIIFTQLYGLNCEDAYKYKISTQIIEEIVMPPMNYCIMSYLNKKTLIERSDNVNLQKLFY